MVFRVIVTNLSCTTNITGAYIVLPVHSIHSMYTNSVLKISLWLFLGIIVVFLYLCNVTLCLWSVHALCLINICSVLFCFKTQSVSTAQVRATLSNKHIWWKNTMWNNGTCTEELVLTSRNNQNPFNCEALKQIILSTICLVQYFNQ